MHSCLSALQSEAPAPLAKPQGPLQARVPPPSSDITGQTLGSEEKAQCQQPTAGSDRKRLVQT